eukprot:gene5533-biopygen4109
MGLARHCAPAASRNASRIAQPFAHSSTSQPSSSPPVHTSSAGVRPSGTFPRDVVRLQGARKVNTIAPTTPGVASSAGIISRTYRAVGEPRLECPVA